MTRSKQDALYDAVCGPNPRETFQSDVTAVFTGVVIQNDSKTSPFIFRPEFELAIADFVDMKVVKHPGPSE